MKISEADILVVPGYTNSGPDHWQSRWTDKMRNAVRVTQADWHKPVLEDWVVPVFDAVSGSSRPVVMIGHSLGAQTIVQAVQRMETALLERIRGAFLVAPPDVENPNIRPRHLMTFGPYPRDPLPFPSVVVASRNDPFCDPEVAADMANCWGSRFIDAGESGHLNAESGHGPWPDGLMAFAHFMAKLQPEAPVTES